MPSNAATEFDTLVARLDTPLVVVTAASGDQRAGCVVGFHSQCSIEPPRYAVWLSKANRTYRVALFATHVALHLLGTEDHALVELFGGETGDEVDKFARCDWEHGPGGVPLLTHSRSWMVLQRTSLWDDGGDHVCLVGTPIDVIAGAATPPLRLSGAAPIEPGHEAEERATPADVDAPAEPPDLDATRRQHLENAAAGAGHPVDVDDLRRTTDPTEQG